MAIERSKFFTLDDPVARTAFRGNEVDPLPAFYRASRGERPAGRLEVTRLMGQTMRDFIWTSGVVPLVTERVIGVLREHDISGWSTYPVLVNGKNDEPINGYSGLAITGRSGTIDFDRRPEALISRDNPSGTKSRYFRGLKFDLASWDGSDMFMDAEHGWILVTERVQKLFRKYKVTNCKFRPIEEVELLATDRDIMPSESL